MSDKTIPLTNELLKRVMTDGLIPRGRLADMDAAKSQGCWDIGPTTANLPASGIYGLAVNLSPGYNFCLQIVARDYSNLIYYRICWAGTWRPWQKISATEQS